MSRKHYMSIFLDEELHEAIEKAASDGRSRSEIGRSALEMYLGIKKEGVDWLEIMSADQGRSKQEMLEDVILSQIEDHWKAIRGEHPQETC